VTHRREPAEPTKIMKPVKPTKADKDIKVSWWWSVVGFVGGMAVVGTFWWYIYPLIIGLFY
jgi:hypothetical protein